MMIEAILIVNREKKPQMIFCTSFFAPNIKGHMESHAKLY